MNTLKTIGDYSIQQKIIEILLRLMQNIEVSLYEYLFEDPIFEFIKKFQTIINNSENVNVPRLPMVCELI